MSALSDCHKAGVLLVVSEPTSEQHLKDFHNWYDTEHGPARLRLGEEFFQNGIRYKERDGRKWLAIYDMKRLSAGSEPRYTILRERRSIREQEVLREKVNVLLRQFLATVFDSTHITEVAQSLVVAAFEVNQKEEETIKRWYSEESLQMLQDFPFHSRARLFKLVDGTNFDNDRVFYVAVHGSSTRVTGPKQDIRKELSKLLSQNREVLPGWSVLLYDFYRNFSADDYRSPDTPRSSQGSTSDTGVSRKCNL